ncbi:MAG: hypothetical protein ABIG40_02235 [Parcubacteria group bacterium]
MIGPSTGWLYAKGIYSLAQQKTILETVKANSVEICLANWDRNDKRMFSLEEGKVFDAQNFIYRSLHLPDVNGQEIEHQLAMVQKAVVRCGTTIALTHPLKVKGDYPTEHYKKMISGGIPLAIENMDSRKDSGFNPAELEKLVTVVDCRFVLDVQHAYEHDPEMKYAGELFDSLENRLAHLHVSGETSDSIHSLVCRATNAKSIIEFVGRVLSAKKVPLILEGEYTTSDELRQEIEFLEKELNL